MKGDHSCTVASWVSSCTWGFYLWYVYYFLSVIMSCIWICLNWELWSSTAYSRLKSLYSQYSQSVMSWHFVRLCSWSNFMVRGIIFTISGCIALLSAWLDLYPSLRGLRSQLYYEPILKFKIQILLLLKELTEGERMENVIIMEKFIRKASYYGSLLWFIMEGFPVWYYGAHQRMSGVSKCFMFFCSLLPSFPLTPFVT